MSIAARSCLCSFVFACSVIAQTAIAAEGPSLVEGGLSLFARSNLVAWCIVPFDAKKRGPEERAQMLLRLGFKRFAYDWRDEHIPTFDEEIETMQRHGISIDAWWFPADLGPASRTILAGLKRHRIKTQLWITMGDPAPRATDQEAKVRAAADVIRPIAREASLIGCTVGLYNHGGWFGEPENQIAIIQALRREAGGPALDRLPVGIVYNFHHGHEHIARFRELFQQMQPYLLAVNLNGMIKDGDKAGKKILTLGRGDQELPMLRVIQGSGWRGPIGILDHRDDTDSEETLRENLRGLDQLLDKLRAPGGGAGVEPGGARLNTNEFVWGAPGGLRFALHPAGFRPREPRGLIRLGYPIGPNGQYELINFIAIEPVVNGRKGYSELERSQTDGRRGKLIRPQGASGTVHKLVGDVEEWEIKLDIERFENGADVEVTLAQRSDEPDELRLGVRSRPGSAAIEYCILTATMGNMARTRRLWLKDRTISSLRLYADYKDHGFAPHTIYNLDQLFRADRGDVLVAITTDEPNPATVDPAPASSFWRYGGVPVTQYWRKRAGTFRDDLHAVVNGRFTYYGSRHPIPGGIAFENFELREKFFEGQEFIFGITKRTPEQLGFSRQ